MLSHQNLLSRSCNNCTACCDGTLLGKAHGHYFYPGKPCFFVISDNCCTIYEDRPKLCKMFECGWIKNESVPEELWPKESGIIIIEIQEEIVIAGIVYGKNPDPLKIKQFEDWASSKNLSIVWSENGRLI